MAKLVILGASNALSSEKSENTHMLLVGEERTVLIDCVTNPIHTLTKLEIDFNDVTDLVLTHFHPDHVCRPLVRHSYDPGGQRCDLQSRRTESQG